MRGKPCRHFKKTKGIPIPTRPIQSKNTHMKYNPPDEKGT